MRPGCIRRKRSPISSAAISVLGKVARRLPPRLQAPLFTLRGSRFNFGRKIDTLHQYGVAPLAHPWLAAKYVCIDPEVDNFTYEIANLDELPRFLAASLDRDLSEMEAYTAEVASDLQLERLVRKQLKKRRWDRKQRPHFGRRVGWYVVARALAPRVIVETGIHDGLGSVLLLRALARNADEGRDGRLISFDPLPQAGWLVTEPLSKRWTPVFQATTDSLEAELEGLGVGMIVHDSEHTYECEHFELTTALAHSAPTIALVSDNAHGTTALRDVASSIGVDYHFFRERPRGHFYPGGGIGLAIRQPSGPAGQRS